MIMVFLWLHPVCAEAGNTVIAVQAIAARPYTEAVDGFKSVLAAETEIEHIILSEKPDLDLAGFISQTAPDLVFVVGSEALRRVKHIQNLPIVFVMVLDAAGDFSNRPNITGINMVVEPRRQLAIIRKAFFRPLTIGLLFDPKQTGDFVNLILSAASESRDISIVAKEVYRAENVPATIMLIRDAIDVLWMLPDLTVVTPETGRILFLLAMEAGRPVVSFSEKYGEQGALMTIGADPYDMGCQAAGMAQKIFSGRPVSSLESSYARKAVITVNTRIAEKLEIAIAPEILNQARKIK
jgi:putative ABC transport system substrate-binding protein